MTISEAKLHAYSMAAVENSVLSVHRCEIKNKAEVTGFLVVNRDVGSTPKDEEFMPVAFNAGLREADGPKEIFDVTPEEYKDIISKKRELPKGWVLKESLFDGIFSFEDIDDLILSVQDWPYSIQIDDDPMLRILGFRCKSGRKWQIKYSDYKRTIVKSKLAKGYSFRDADQKNLFLQYLNIKPFFCPTDLQDRNVELEEITSKIRNIHG